MFFFHKIEVEVEIRMPLVTHQRYLDSGFNFSIDFLSSFTGTFDVFMGSGAGSLTIMSLNGF
jgi:hypothetical protein